MSDDKPAKKGGKAKKTIVMILGVLILGGGGAAGGYYGARALGVTGGHAPAEDPNMPKLVLEGEGLDLAAAGEHNPDGPQITDLRGTVAPGPGVTLTNGRPVDPTKYHATYYPLEQPFTSNLRDTDSYAQIAIAVGTYYDGRVIQNIKEQELPLRSAILMKIADTSADAMHSPTGRAALQKELTTAINDVLTQKSGFGGVDNVYFTNFVIQ